MGPDDLLGQEAGAHLTFRNGISWAHFCGSHGCMPLQTSCLNIASAPGPAQPAIDWWYVGSLIDLWLTPIALATAYYLIPKLVGRPIYSYKLALFGFWWSGTPWRVDGNDAYDRRTASGMDDNRQHRGQDVNDLIPVLAVAANFHLTMRGEFERV